MNFKSFSSAIALAAAFVAAPATAAILFQDNFDSDHVSSVLDVASLNNWTISNGTVDYIRSGGFGITCFGGTGGCLDMDGSTNNAGRITSIATYNFLAGVTYTLEAQVSGNQRGGPTDSISLGFFDTVAVADAASATYGGIASADPFAPRTIGFTPGSAGTYRLFIEGVGGDNVGVILDNVLLRDDRTAVPEPATLLLSGLALLAAGAARRRLRG
jgi:hypothetical protein